MQFLKQSTAASIVVGPVLDSTGASYASAVIGDFTLSKNGTSAALASAATATHEANGMYILALTTGNTDTLGRADVYCNKATYAMGPKSLEVLTGATFDALVTNAAGASNGLFRFGDVLATVTTLTNLPAITADWLTGTGTAASAVTKIQAGLSTYSGGAVASVTGAVGSVTSTVNATLVSTGLDAIATTAPTGPATTFREMMVQVWRRYFKKSAKAVSGLTVKTYADNGTTVITTQAYTDDGAGNETLGGAT